MRTEGIAAAYLASGWCGRCGGKRDHDGNCANCDRWYNHPLLMLGGGLTISVVVLMLVGIRAVRDADPGFARFASGTLYAASVPAFAPTMPSGSGQVSAPRFSHPAAPLGSIVSAPPTTPKVSPLEAQFVQLESLRTTVHTGEHAFQTGVVAPEAAPAAGRGFKPAIAQATTTTELAR